MIKMAFSSTELCFPRHFYILALHSINVHRGRCENVLIKRGINTIPHPQTPGKAWQPLRSKAKQRQL